MLRSIILYAFIICISACAPSFEEKYFEENSGIKLPVGYKVLKSYDDGEKLAVVKIQLPKDKVDTFIAENNFKPFTGKFAIINIQLGAVGEEIPGAGSVEAKDCGYCNCWHYVVDKSTGMLWAQVNYADHSGDCPTGKHL